MSIFKQETIAKAKEIAAGYPIFAENLYDVQVFDVKVVEVNETVWNGSHPTKTDKMVDQVEVTLKLLKTVDGNLPTLVDGKETDKDLIKFWFDPLKLGFNGKTKEPTKARKFLCAVQGLADNAPLSLDMLDKWIEDTELCGKNLKCFITVTVKEDGTKKNVLSRFTATGKKMDIEPKTAEEVVADVKKKK
jgi:hypothetical protein